MSHVLLFAYFLREKKKESLWNRELSFEHFFGEFKQSSETVVFSYRAPCQEEYYH